MSFDLGVYDSDGDLTVVKDGLQVLLSPDDHQVATGTSGVDNLSGAGWTADDAGRPGGATTC